MSQVPEGVGKDDTDLSNASEFWKEFDAMSDEYKKQLVETMNSELDTLLIFATLFSAINVAFLVIALPSLSPSPADETNALLRILISNTANATVTEDLVGTPSGTPPWANNLAINQLFASSLTCSLITSFGCVLGKQWLTTFGNAGDGSPQQKRRNTQLQIAGAETWYFRPLLEVVLPTIIQISLFLFVFGFVLFLQPINTSLAIVNATLACCALAVYIGTTGLALWDPACPFQTPWSRSLIPGTARFLLGFALSSFGVLYIIGWAIIRFFVTLWDSRVDASFWKTYHDDAVKVVNRWTFHDGQMKTWYHALTRSIVDYTRKRHEINQLDATSLCWIFNRGGNEETLAAASTAFPNLRKAGPLSDVLHRNTAGRLLELRDMALDEENRAAIGWAFLHLYIFSVDSDEWWWANAVQILKSAREDAGKRSPQLKALHAAGLIKVMAYEELYVMLNRDEVDRPRYNFFIEDLLSAIEPLESSIGISLLARAMCILNPTDFGFTKEAWATSLKQEYPKLWEAYTSESAVLDNVISALDIYTAERNEGASTSTGLMPWSKFDEVVKALGDWISIPQNFSSEDRKLEFLKASPDLIKSCSELSASVPPEDGVDAATIRERMLEQGRYLSDTVIKRLGDIEVSSPAALAAAADAMTYFSELHLETVDEAAYQKALSGLTNACCRYLPSRQPTEKPGPAASPQPSASDDDADQYGAQIVKALGSTLNAGVQEQAPSDQAPPNVGRTPVDDVVRVVDVLAGRDSSLAYGEASIKTWASDAVLIAMTRYTQHLLQLPSDLDGMEQARSFVAYYANAVGERRWEVLSSEQTRRQFQEEYAKLDATEKEELKDASATPSPPE